MEKKFLEKLTKKFPHFSFKIIREKMDKRTFGYDERETLLIDKTPIGIAWTPPLSECSQGQLKHIWSKVWPRVKKIVTEKGKLKSTKILHKLKELGKKHTNG